MPEKRYVTGKTPTPPPPEYIILKEIDFDFEFFVRNASFGHKQSLSYEFHEQSLIFWPLVVFRYTVKNEWLLAVHF